MSRVLISSPLVSETEDAEAIASLRAAGHELTFRPDLVGKSEDDVIAAIDGMHGVVASTEPYTRRVIESSQTLRVLSRTGVGYDAIDLDAATDRSVAVCTTVGSNDRTVADWAVLAMLALSRKLPAAMDGMSDGRWVRPVGLDFWGKTIGIIGLGAIGKHVTRRVRAFECEVLAYDVVKDDAFAAEIGVRYVEIDQLVEQSDFVTVHTLLVPATRGMINEQRLRRMKPTAYLVNTSRGPIVDEGALLDALRARAIAGAGLDVYDTEPLPPDHPLRSAPNTVLTPHLGYVTTGNYVKFYREAVEDIAAHLRGEPVRMLNG